MNLIPMPKKTELYDGFLSDKTVKLVSKITDERLMNAVNKLSRSDTGTLLEIITGDKDCEAYTLTVQTNRIVITSEGVRGAFYGVQTLRQLLREETVPCLVIEDEPDFEHRGFYHDATRGRVPTVEAIKRMIDEMAYYKMNSLQLYVEHTYEFKEFADSIEKTGYLTAEEIRELDNYANLNFIEFVPSIATFGHLFELLEKKEYQHLREIDGFEAGEFYWENRMGHHTIDPTREESFELIKSLLDQYMENFTTDKFNICCDETFDLKIGKHKDMDTGKLYIDFVTKIINYLQGKGKKVMMWADILLNHPEQIDKLPEGVELLNWYYWNEPDENTFKTICEAKRPQIVCPGTGTWNRLCEDYETEIINITKMTDFGMQYGAHGVLNTNWGDWGNSCSIELAMFGLVFGAERSWNVKTQADADYIKRVNSLLYESENGTQYIERLSAACARIYWVDFAKLYANLIKENTYELNFPTKEDMEKSIAECGSLISDVSADKAIKNCYREHIILAAEGVMVMAEQWAKHAGYTIDRTTDTEKWLADYRRLWLSESKESELSEIEKMFRMVER